MATSENAPSGSLVGLLADLVGLLADLVAFPTESRTSNLELIDLYADRAATAGAVVTVVHGETGRANLHLRFGPDAPGGVLLSGHTDVVPAGSGWATDPYELTEVGGQLRARGSADMKGFLAAALVLMEATDVDALRAPVHLGLSYDEEIGCVGVHGLLDVLAAGGSCAPDVVVVGTGVAGMTAALRLLDRGARVVLLDKERQVGGNSAKGAHAGFGLAPSAQRA